MGSISLEFGPETLVVPRQSLDTLYAGTEGITAANSVDFNPHNQLPAIIPRVNFETGEQQVVTKSKLQLLASRQSDAQYITPRDIGLTLRRISRIWQTYPWLRCVSLDQTAEMTGLESLKQAVSGNIFEDFHLPLGVSLQEVRNVRTYERQWPERFDNSTKELFTLQDTELPLQASLLRPPETDRQQISRSRIRAKIFGLGWGTKL